MTALPRAHRFLLEQLMTEASCRWSMTARPEQLPPDWQWTIWLMKCGRGWGKTRTGGEWVKEKIESGTYRLMACFAPTADDVRKVMVEGPSGLLSLNWRPGFEPDYQPGNKQILFPGGQKIQLYSAEKPKRLEGPQWEGAWCDEIRNWQYPQAWDSLILGLRIGDNPQIVVTTTPSPSSKILKDLTKRAKTRDGVHLTRGSTYDNLDNLSPVYKETILRQYKGTRIEKQELEGLDIEDVEGALWKRADIEALRIDEPPDMDRIIVAIDPAVTSNEDSDETGIVVYGRSNGHCYLLEDLSGIYTPDGWGRKAVRAYHKWRADCIIGEVNNGGEMVEHVIRTTDKKVKFKKVWASRGKIVRAEPCAQFTEKGEDHHVGVFPELEDQLCQFDGTGKSPDRLDAKVWAITELMLGEAEPGFEIW